MIGEIWYYKAKLPNSDEYKVRPVLVIGNDANNNLLYADIDYVIISSSSPVGIYDVVIEENIAKSINLIRKSIIKTTKIYTGPRTLFERKLGVLPENLKQEFINKYREYQNQLINSFLIEEYV